MQEPTAGEIVTALFASGASPADRFNVLVGIVLDLMMEVQALRDERLRRGQDLGSYRESYRDNALLPHNSAGTSTGWEKLLREFYPRQRRPDGRVWRESLMLRRLGFTAAEIAAFEDEAEQSETYT
jgi:hypothetical protein